jgi:hypothetical protein
MKIISHVSSIDGADVAAANFAAFPHGEGGVVY